MEAARHTQRAKIRSLGSTMRRHVYDGGRPRVLPHLWKETQTWAQDLDVLPERKPPAYSVMLLTEYYKPVQAALDNWGESLFIVT